METILENLKQYIRLNLPDYLLEKTTEEVPLIDLTDNTIIIGDCDIAKYSSGNTLFINPDSIVLTDLSISDYEQILSLDFLMVCRNDKASILYKRVNRYIDALKSLFIADLNLEGIGSIDLKSIDYFDGMEGNTSIKALMLSCELSW